MTPKLKKKWWLFWLSSVFALASLSVWIRTATISETYQFVHREKELKALRADLEVTRLNWIRKTSPGELERLAFKTGLSTPKQKQYIKISPVRTGGAHVAP